MASEAHTITVASEHLIAKHAELVLATPHVKLGKVPIAYVTTELMRPHVHGLHAKNGVTLHETVSPDYPGLRDVTEVARYLAAKDYGIYAVIDEDANIACAIGLGKAIFYHADSTGRRTGHVNTLKIGIELVSRVMLEAPTNAQRRKLWVARHKQLVACAKLCATLSHVHGWPLRASTGDAPGITTHWEVTHTYQVPGGHTDCWPVDKGGYFPRNEVVALARRYRGQGY